MPKPPPRPKNDYTRVFAAFGVGFAQRTGAEVVAEECPWCAGDRCYVNADTGLYDCKKCRQKGNVTTYLTWVHGEYLKATTDDHYRELKERRGISLQTLKRHGLAYDAEAKRWLIPFKNPKGNVVNVQFYEADGMKRNLPGLPLCVYGFEKLAAADKSKIVFVCEGPFDAIALDYNVGSNNRPKYVIVATPGAFKEDWAEAFRGRKVRVLYDNDKAGREQGERVQKLIGETGIAEEVRVLKWPDGFPDGCDVNDLVRDPALGVPLVVGWALENSFKVVPQPKLDIEHGWERVEAAPEVIEWPWPNRLRCGTYVSFAGKRGTLKSTIARELIARYTTGRAMPACDEPGMPPGHALYITAEDSKETAWAGLKLAGADFNKLAVMPATLRDGDALNILDHLDEIRQMIRRFGIRFIVIDGQNSVVGAPNISTDMLARHNVSNKLHQFAQKENVCLIGIRNEDSEGRALGPQSMGDLARCILRAEELPPDGEDRYFRLVFERISDAAPRTHPPLPYAVEDLGGSDRRIDWGKKKPSVKEGIDAGRAKRATLTKGHK